ncbi:MAG: N-glycosylase/DNA lyase [Nanoarchaeota archaeon]
MDLITKIKNLKKTQIKLRVDKKLKEFSSFKNKNSNEWFSELCFCILTANSKAKTAINIQNDLKAIGFCNFSENKIKKCIIKNKHRFHNNKTNYIICAREFINIKQIINEIIKKDDEIVLRDFIVKNIKGLGYKEASHFLRNVGFFNFAILDRHIINLMIENKIIKEKPNNLSNKKTYVELEKQILNIANKLKMSAAELDLYMWYLKTNEVLK